MATTRRSCDVAGLRLTKRAANKKEVFKMATQGLSASRIILAGGFAVAALATPAVITLAASHTTTSFGACASGESEDIYTNVCVPDLVPNSPEVGTIPGNPSLPEISGIPCSGANSGQCIGLGEEQQAEGPQPIPHSSVSSSP